MLYKKCPRCGNKCLADQTKCEECDLLFSRLEFCSNKAAKKKLLHFDRDFIIYTKDLPKDVKWWKLCVLTVFTGLFGGHYYYVGKFIKGLLMSLMMVYSILCTIFNPQISALSVSNSSIETLIYAPMGVFALSWIVSLVFVLSRKFKVPVIVDIPQAVEVDMKAKRADFERTKKELKAENEKAKDSNKKN